MHPASTSSPQHPATLLNGIRPIPERTVVPGLLSNQLSETQMNHRPVMLAAASLLAAAALVACSDDAPIAANSNGEPVVKVTMTDMAFSPSTITVKAGETVHFQFHNSGAVIHEAVFGDEADQEHALLAYAIIGSP